MSFDAPDIAALAPWLTVDRPDEDGEWAAFCPLHNDTNASASFNFDKGVWRCFAGCEDGVIPELIWKLEELGVEAGDTEIEAEGDNGGFVASVTDIRSKRRRGAQPLPTAATVAGWSSALLSDAKRLGDLFRRRGITRETVEDFALGWDKDEEAYTIPFAENGQLVNVKHYRLDMQDHDKKMFGVVGHNEARLYPEPPDPSLDEVLVLEGEMDTILARQFGFNAVTGSGGAKVWKPDWNKHFQDKRVFVCMDSDKTGHVGRKKILNNIKSVAKEVFFVDLPFPVEEKNGKDVTDFWHETKDTFASEFKELMRTSERKSGEAAADADVLDIGILDSMNIELAGRPLRMRAQIVARTGSTKSFVSKADIKCFKNKNDLCNFCPMLTVHGMDDGSGLSMEMEVEPGDPDILMLVKKGAERLKVVARERYELRCKDIIVTPTEKQNVQVVGVRRAVDDEEEEATGEEIGDDDITSIRKVILSPNFDVMPNRTVNIVGRVTDDPDTKDNEFLAWEVHDTESSLDKFRMSPEMHERLKVFQPLEGQRPMKRCGDIARDLASNVTKIVGREDLHIAMDLVWHSVLRFRFQDTLIQKGWLEMMVAGDTRTGKSKVAGELAAHYGAGRVISAETASFAGLVGGAQKVGEEWSVTWGILPLSDRRLVVVDEVSGLSHSEIGMMSSVRSSGVAELHKITGDSVRARTRLIWMGNPRSGHQMKDMGDGVNVIQELLGAPEDIARLDFAMSVTNEDVDPELINSQHVRREHAFTRDLCHDLVMWAWSRKVHHIQWARGAEHEVIKKALEMGRHYVEDPPLVQSANMREKIARLAVALAARTYSSPDGETLVVTRQHVRDVVRFLDHLYGNVDFGYRDRSRRRIKRKEEAQKNRDAAYDMIMGDEKLERFFNDLDGVTFTLDKMESTIDVGKEEAKGTISKLVAMGYVTAESDNKTRTEFRMSRELIDVLRMIRKETQ